MNALRTRGTRRRIRAAATAAAVGTLLAVAACGGGSGSEASGDGLPDTITIPVTVPLTGAGGFAGTEAEKGYDLAIQEINDTDFLEGTTLELDKRDTKSTPQQATSDLTSIAADRDVPVTLGSLLSGEAVAQSPIADKQKLPIVYIQAGSEGVLTGDYTFRMTAPQQTFYPIIEQFLEEKGATRIGVVYGPWVPTIKELGEVSVPAAAEAVGAEVVATAETQQTTQDFSAAISKVLDEDPDVVAVLQIGAANATVMKQLREAGYDGPVIGNSSAGAGSLAPAGEGGAGMAWPVDFHPDADDAATAAFVELYEAEYGETPLNYAAEAYDAVWFIARALKAAGTTDREDVAAALRDQVGEPFTGALGTDLAFDGNDLRVPGVVVEWDGTQENLLYSGE